MSVLLFGGTFDPPHIGHMDLLRNAVFSVQPEHVLVMPAALPPHKQASGTPKMLRLAMCQCFVPLFPQVEISEMEMKREGKSYTVDTLLQLEKEYPGEELFLSMGADMLLSFTRWHKWQEILQLATLVVQGRAGTGNNLFATAAQLEKEGGSVVFASGKAAQISSTLIRQGLAKAPGLLAFVPPPANNIIREHHLYGFEEA